MADTAETEGGTHPPLFSTTIKPCTSKVLAGSPIGVIGTGNAAIAITKRLLSTSFSVIVGSRKPTIRHATLNKLGHCLCGAELTSIDDCLRRCDVIIIAIHMENFKVTLEPYSRLTRGKILIDMSNRESRYVTRSNAEYLASILPEAEVVKSFNTISAATMENKLDMGVESQKVFVACDNENVRSVVLDLTRSMGFHGVDYGNLRNSLHIEDFVLKVFTHWKIPIFLTFGIFNLWSLYIVYIYFIDKTAYKWEQVFLKVLNKPVCMTAMTTLALTYLPGQLASIIQVCRGTKHSLFPRILDTWLKSRKQFGLITFCLVCFHVIASTLMLSPTYYRSWFHQPSITFPGQGNGSSTVTLASDSKVIQVSAAWMVWKGELALFFGITAFICMSIQAITSIKSVGNSLNWSEWRCVQSNMGTWVLILAACHVFSMGIPGWLKVGPTKTLASITFLSLILPLFVLMLKFIFNWTPLNCYLNKIRKGWERTKDDHTRDKNLNMDDIRLGKQIYVPLSSKKLGQRKTCCVIEEEEEENVNLTNDEDADSDTINTSGDSNVISCCCNDEGVLKDNIMDSRTGGDRSKNTVRFSTSTKCDCSPV